MIPNPIPDGSVDVLSKVTRKVFCTYYDLCLDIAVESRWISFACSACRAFRSRRFNEEEGIKDALACKALLMSI